VDHLSAVNFPASPSSTAKIQVPAIPLEQHIGKKVALTASALAAGVGDYANSGTMTVATKIRVANLFAELVELRRVMIPFWDFDAICHQHGRLMLAEACGGMNVAEQAIVDTLINAAVLIVRKTALLKLH